MAICPSKPKTVVTSVSRALPFPLNLGGVLRVGLTGAAGFIGSHLAKELQGSGCEIVWAVDSLKPSYGGDMSVRRLKSMGLPIDVLPMDLGQIGNKAIAESMPEIDVLIHLAALPGVRQGESHADDYFRANVVGFNNLLLAAEIKQVDTIFFASSSSVYGDRGLSGPSNERDADGTGIKSHYGMTKWINEMQARDFTRRTRIASVGLRLFTVFGEWGRPDMAYFKLGSQMLRGLPITLYGDNGGVRNFTYVKDTTRVIKRLLEIRHVFHNDIDSPASINVATGNPMSTKTFLDELATALDRSPLDIIYTPRPREDAKVTWADTSILTSLIGDLPETEISEGIQKLARWLLSENTMYEVEAKSQLGDHVRH